MPNNFLHALPGNMAKAWADYFRLRFLFGTEQPPVVVETVPTVILDDNSSGPFPVYRPVIIGLSAAAGGAGFWSSISISNLDPTDSRSVLAIDWVRYVTSAASNLLHGVGASLNGVTAAFLANAANQAAGSVMTFADVGAERELPPVPNVDSVTAGPLQNVKLQTIGAFQRITLGRTLTEVINATALPSADASPHDMDGPFLLGPGQALFLEPDIANTALRIYARGRYYPRP